MPITTLDHLIESFQKPIFFFKLVQTAEGAGTYHSMWKASGYPVAGATPPAYSSGSGYTCSNSTTGALQYTDPAGGVYSYLTRFSCASLTVSKITLYDRLWTCSGFVTNSVSTQTVTTPGSLPNRDMNGVADGDGVELWGEIYTAPGATGATWTVNYKDQDNNNGAATYTHPANAESVGQMFPFVLASGDTGVRSVVDFTCSISSGTAGVIGITLLRRIAEIPITLAGSKRSYDAVSLGFPRIYDSSCLAWMVRCSTTASGNIFGSVTFAEG